MEALGLEPGAHVVDVGAGTGKFARQLVARGLRVTGVEPIAEMREIFERTVGAEALEGTAESIPLDDGSADAVTAAQAFHWFDPERALPELKRVLRPRGGVALVWNVRDETHPLHQSYAEAIRPYKGDDYPVGGHPGNEPLASPLFTDVAERTFPHVQLMDADGLAARAASVSFVARLPEHERAELLERVRTLAPPGTFEFPYVTKVFTGRSR
ncbi:MAG: methyltransferase domain-containing protein [Actinobacteria bacterium]|nr:methyltransferase domain-containing protein [Actinomycetota bacterium]